MNDVALIPLSLPIRLGGFGLRSLHWVSPAAYWASLARAAPYILKFVPNPDRLIRGELKAAVVDDVSSCHQALCSMVQKVPKDFMPSACGPLMRLQKALTALVDDGVAAHCAET